MHSANSKWVKNPWVLTYYPFFSLKSFLFLIAIGIFLNLSGKKPELPPYGLDNPESIGKFLNGNLPTTTPSSGSTTVTSWKVENAFPNIDFVDPVDMREYPGTNRFVIAGKDGRVWTFENNPNVSSRTLFLDIRSRVRTAGDCGILGIVFHPEFGQSGSPNRGYVYLYYRYTQDKGRSDHLAYVRLSRFTVPDGQQVADEQSEYVLIQQYDRHDWHNGGSMFFHPTDGFLYFIMGDEGGAQDEFNAGQQITKNFFGGLHRIDVDRRGGSISHPIRRQPAPPVAPPSGWPGTFSQGYYVPNDNPWVNSDGSTMEEFWALGLRSPHRMWYDPPTGDIWVGDIGQGAREEISIMHKGDNAQWPYKEGFRNGFKAKPSPLIGTDTPPLLDYSRSDGSSIIGGLVYRGSKWASSLGGKYIFSDNVVQNIWTVDYYNTGSNQKEIIATIPFETNNWKDGVSHIYTDQAGEVYILQLAGHNRAGGRIYKLAPQNQSPSGSPAPALLSQTGAFSNLSNMTPNSGVIPFEPNVTFWSDGAIKTRWVALPNNGTHNSSSEKISFSENGEWTFPKGTVFIKHFEFPVDDTNPSVTQKIETRFTVHGDDGQYYFLTYRWREDQSDADLLSGAQDRNLTIQTTSGSRTQVWHYPSKTECITCHNSTAKQVLGMNTRQMNGNLRYPQTGTTANQLETLNSLGWFSPSLTDSEIAGFDAVKPISNGSASLEDKALSYLDVNCGYCHRPGALQTSFDLRYITPLASQGILNVDPGNNLGISGAKLILPGDPSKSIIFQRLISIHEGVMMPPLAKNVVDQEGMVLIENWINSLSTPSDDQAPSIPSGLVASNITAESVDLSWSSASDNVGVSGYLVYQDGTPGPIQSISNTQTTVSGLSPETTYFFAVAAFDQAGNISAQSAALQVVTSAAPEPGTCTTPYNLALNQATDQSSVYGNGASNLAVDGNTSGSGSPWGSSASLMHTQNESQPWWQVDLGQLSSIDEVFIYNRTSCCQNRLKDFYVLVSSQPFSTSATLSTLLNDSQVSSFFYSGSAGNTVSVPINTDGRYVRIQFSGSGTFHVAEIEVRGCPGSGGGDPPPGDPCEGKPSVSIDPAGPFTPDQGTQQLVGSPAGGSWSGSASSSGSFNPSQGAGTYQVTYTVDLGDGCTKSASIDIEVQDVSNPPPPPTGECNQAYNLALNQTGSQSSVYGNGQSSLAFDGNTDGSGSPWGSSASLMHTQTEPQPWVQVDLGQISSLEQIHIYNRTSCCQNRLKDFYILTSTQPISNSASLSTLLADVNISATFYSGAAGNLVNISLSTSARYVRLQLSGSGNPLHIAEMEVMGCPGTGGEDPPSHSCADNPEVAIASAGPFTTDQEPQQLIGSPNGGSWSGPVSSSGVFDPGQGVGTYWIYYTVVFDDNCWKYDSLIVDVNEPSSSDPCAGKPTVSITSAGSFTTDQGLQQLSGSPSGGSWSGAADASGNFDPSVGTGTYTVIYTVDLGDGCVRSASTEIEVQNASSPPSGPCSSPYNLALNQSTVQSSVYGNGTSNLAVDGNTDGSGSPWGSSASLMHTQNESQPWWQIDLGQQASIDEVFIYNRTSCCQNRLKDFYVLISSQPISTSASLSTLLNDSQVSSLFFSGAAGNTVSIPANTEGRYVRIQLSGSGTFHVAEIEVRGCPGSGGEDPPPGDPCEGKPSVSIDPAGPFTTDQGTQQISGSPVGGTWSGAVSASGIFDPSQGAGTYQVTYTVDLGDGCSKSANASIVVQDPTGGGEPCTTPTNQALNKPVSQSSQYGDGRPELGVNGDVNGSNGPWGANASLAHTVQESEPWWQVDLGQQTSIEFVTLFNRTDCCQGRLKDFYVFVSSSPFASTATLSSLRSDPNVSATHFPGSAGNTETISINSVGRYVRIQVNTGSGYLHFAEFEVHGCPDPVNQNLRIAQEDVRKISNSNKNSEENEWEELQVYPNPFDEVVTLRYSSKARREVTLNIFNSVGQLVYQRGWEESLSELTVPTRDWSSGMYIFHIQTPSKLKILKILKN